MVNKQSPFDYVKDPDEIYRRSFANVRAEASLDRFSDSAAAIAVRLIHACGMVDIASQLRFSDSAPEVGHAAVKNGVPIFVDSKMVGSGIIQNRLHQNNQVICTLNDDRVPDLAAKLGTTRSAAAVDLWGDCLEGAIAVFGNAPTALFHLLENIAVGGPKPAIILGFPVGFIGAAESKDALIDHAGDVSYITLLGRQGGSAIAAAAVNALAGDIT